MTGALTADGRAIEYDITGAATATPMILIQGLSAQLIGWRQEFCDMLADRGFRVIRFDNRDAGLSQKYPGAHYGLPEMADDTVALMDVLTIDRAHIVGQSMGGMIAQEVAIRAPSRTASLCLIYTGANTAAVRNERDHESLGTRPPNLSRSDAIEQYVVDESYCRSTAYPFDTEWIRELGGEMWDRCYYPEGIHRQVEAVDTSRDRTRDLRNLRVPTLIIHGTADRLIDVQGGQHLATTIPGAELRTYPGMGHELPRALWPNIVDAIVDNAARSIASDIKPS